MQAVAIVQARTGSSRLPNKVLMDIEGKPMLWHVVSRLKYSKLIDRIVIATTADRRDDCIEKFCKENKVDFFRGDENDVLDRYYQAAKIYKADPVIRITSDCPVIDPRVIDKAISIYLENRDSLDYVRNSLYPRGLDTEVFSFCALERTWKEAQKDYQREHVTIYMYENAGTFKVHIMKNEKDLSHLRWTVDEDKDLKLVREIYKRLCGEGEMFLMEDILKLLEKEPQLTEINKMVRQKAVLK